MRRFLLLPLLILAIGVVAQQSGTMYVAAKSGLSIREKPDAAAKVLDKIPYGTKITLIYDTAELKSLVTEGITGYWQKVKYNNKTGYILDSYLFPWPSPKLATVKEMKNYFAQVTVPFGAKLVVKNGTVNNYAEQDGWEINKQLYKNGAEWHHYLGYESSSDAYFLPGFSIEQGFLLLRLIPEFKDVFGEKEEFPTETKTYKKGDVEYTITVNKLVWADQTHTYVEKIHIEFSPDVSWSFDMSIVDGELVITFGGGV
jgi:Bacterial SH3 domain